MVIVLAPSGDDQGQRYAWTGFAGIRVLCTCVSAAEDFLRPRAHGVCHTVSARAARDSDGYYLLDGQC